MIQAEGINFKSAGSLVRRKLDRRFFAGLLVLGLVLAAFLYWRYFNHLLQVCTPPTASHIVSAATLPAAKLKPAAGSTKPDDKPELAKTDSPAPAKAATAGFADYLMSVLSPSARAETAQPEIRFARKPAKGVTIQTAYEPQPLTAEQKRLKLAQDGFDEIMDLAYKYPDAYGFMPEENLRAARLGDPIPVYMIAQQSLENYTGQPLKSLLKPADEWIFPVILDDRIRFMVQVRYVGHNYVLGHGSRALAMVYDKILAHWPASEGYHPQLVINPNMPFYYFTIPELPEPNITDTDRMLEFNPSLSPANVILASWR
jgi:hypothetical protein